jgi:hypothetical protein
LNRLYHRTTSTVANYNLSVQEVYIEAASSRIFLLPHLGVLSNVGDSSLNAVQNLPSWVLDLSVPERPQSFEKYDELFSADGNQPRAVNVNGKVLVLQTSLLDHVAAASETSGEINEECGIARLLQVLRSPRLVYVHSKETYAIAARKSFMADTLSAKANDMIKVMNSDYDMTAGFERTLFAILALDSREKAK